MSRAVVRGSLVVALVSTGVGWACRTPAGSGEYRAEIRRTSHRVAHITAADMGSLGFGEGFAAAEDHLCSIADQVVRVRGERARYFGPGDGDANLHDDVAVKALDIRAGAGAGLAAQPREIQDMLAGYAAGYNKYLSDTGRDRVPGWCRGQEWVAEIEPADIYAYARSIVLTFNPSAIATASPPETSDGEAARDERGSSQQVAAVGAWNDGETRGASNGWAIGRDRSESGGGMLVANPHYPWVGSNRFWEKHLTIPGQLDVYGVSLVGLPGVALGFNESVAWTHTVSAGERFTLYRLDLVPGSPTTYRYDGEERQMTPKTVRIDVRQPDGTVSPREQVVWFSHYGPIVNLPGMPWTATMAVAARDANEANDGMLAQWLDMDRATTLDAFEDAHRRWNAMPWVNTVAASRDGRAWYADGSATPNLSQEALDLWNAATRSDPLTRQAWAAGRVLLDGSDSRFEWQTDPDARDPGVVSFARKPQLERADYVFNANDSYWMPNSKALLTGYSRMHGSAGEPVSLRTRINDRMLGDTSPDGPAGRDGRFSFEELKAGILSNRSEAAELLLDALVARCRAEKETMVDGRHVNLAAACDVLGSYNGRVDLDSVGAVLFREWITQYTGIEQREAGVLFVRPFDPADPAGTPSGLAAGPLALQRLGRAVQILERAGLPLAATLRDTQIAYRGRREIPVHGGLAAEGVANVINYAPNLTTLEPDPEFTRVEGSRFLTTRGYPVNRGTSFLLAVEFTAAGPRAEAFLTYSQSGDPESPFFSDQTELFARKAWRPVPFKASDVAAAAESTAAVTGPRESSGAR